MNTMPDQNCHDLSSSSAAVEIRRRCNSDAGELQRSLSDDSSLLSTHDASDQHNCSTSSSTIIASHEHASYDSYEESVNLLPPFHHDEEIEDEGADQFIPPSCDNTNNTNNTNNHDIDTTSTHITKNSTPTSPTITTNKITSSPTKSMSSFMGLSLTLSDSEGSFTLRRRHSQDENKDTNTTNNSNTTNTSPNKHSSSIANSNNHDSSCASNLFNNMPQSPTRRKFTMSLSIPTHFTKSKPLFNTNTSTTTTTNTTNKTCLQSKTPTRTEAITNSFQRFKTQQFKSWKLHQKRFSTQISNRIQKMKQGPSKSSQLTLLASSRLDNNNNTTAVNATNNNTTAVNITNNTANTTSANTTSTSTPTTTKPSRIIIIPSAHPYKITWDILTIILTFLSAYYTHTSIRDRSYTSTPFFLLSETWFLLDILLNFITEHQTSSGQLIRDGSAVWARYLTTWFVVDALSLFPWEWLFVVPIIERQNKRNILVKTFFRSKAVVKVTRILRGRHFRLFGKVAKRTKSIGVGGKRLLRLIIKYVPKYVVFYRNMKGVLVLKTLRQIHFTRKVTRGLYGNGNTANGMNETDENNESSDNDVAVATTSTTTAATVEATNQSTNNTYDAAMNDDDEESCYSNDAATNEDNDEFPIMDTTTINNNNNNSSTFHSPYNNMEQRMNSSFSKLSSSSSSPSSSLSPSSPFRHSRRVGGGGGTIRRLRHTTSETAFTTGDTSNGITSRNTSGNTTASTTDTNDDASSVCTTCSMEKFWILQS